ncbi:hypothetical protein GBAR_LOCUS12714 [Geodia barretti]|uniref:Death domain-containing protein n=1 Tax=Geodia barretti TaxID=519541 RepID=A0AA35WLJ4_GEOBA|nr:hypothetical protein GBAR_LOCUS12714 [Geodia barretti]
MNFRLRLKNESQDYEDGVDALPFLYRVLHQLASRWNSLSLQLSVSGQDEIQRNARSADICLAVSLVEWLQSGQATWKALVEAVFRPAGGGHQVLARDIARNYKGLCQFRPNSFAATVQPMELGKTFLIRTVCFIVIRGVGETDTEDAQQLCGCSLVPDGCGNGGAPSDLEIIRESPEYHGAGEREAGMLKAWLERGSLPRTWQVLVDTVEDRAGGNHKVLAKKIANSPLDTFQVAPSSPQARNSASAGQPALNPASTRTLDSTPSLRDLSVFKTRSGEKIEIIKSLAPDWKSFGVHLNFDDMGSQLSLIEAQHGQSNPQSCCRDMVIHWLLGNGEGPTTWRTLLALLEDGERAYLADRIRRELTDPAYEPTLHKAP